MSTGPSAITAGQPPASTAPGQSSSAHIRPLSSAQEIQLLTVLSTTMFITFTSSSMLAPLLLELADEFHTSLGTVGALTAAASIPWAILAPFMGALSDRYGRRPVLSIGLAALGLAVIASAFAWDYNSLFVIRLIGGIGGATTGPNAMAAPADYFPPNRRGRALGLVLAGMSLATIVGVPLIAFASAHVGWRVAFAGLGVLHVVLAAAVWILLPRGVRSTTRTSIVSGLMNAVGSRMSLLMLLANLLERCSFSATTTYLAAFLMQAYGIPLEGVAPVLSVIAAGTLAGSLFGGRLADRGRQRIQYAALLSIMGALAFPLFATVPGIVLTCIIAAGFGIAGSLARPSWFWLLTRVPESRRGAATGFAATTNQVGVIVGSAMGGMLLGPGGYVAVGALACAAALCSALSCILSDAK